MKRFDVLFLIALFIFPNLICGCAKLSPISNTQTISTSLPTATQSTIPQTAIPIPPAIPTAILTEMGRAEVGSSINDLTFSPDGKTIAVAGEKGITLFEVINLKPRWSQPSTQAVNSISFSPDGFTLASGADDKEVKLWETSSGSRLRVLTGFQDWVGGVAFSPKDELLAVGSFQTITLWDTQSWKILHTLKGHTGYLWHLSFSTDSKLLASTSVDQTIALWDIQTVLSAKKGKEKAARVLRGSTYWVRSAAFSPDGKQIAAGSGDGNVYLWDVHSGKRIFTLRGHSGYVWQVAFSPDGKTLASASDDQRVIFWDMQKGQAEHQIETPSSAHSLTFSPDKEYLGIGLADGSLILYQLPANEQREQLK